jgi:hypothetical protein
LPGIIYLAFFILGGLFIGRCWLPCLRPLVRWYVGASVGLLLFLWLPALWAYAVTFSVTAHLTAALTMVVVMLFAYASRDQRPLVRMTDEDSRILRVVLWVSIPLTVLAAWLMFTHSIRPTADGTYHVGQSTYGDLSLHLAVATSAVNAPFPLQNSLMVGATMAYPYLSDTFATSLYMLGLTLPGAMFFTGTVLCAWVFYGYTLLVAQLVRRRGAAALAAMLLFANGGLGFFYTLSGRVDGSAVTTVWDNLKTVFTGYYQTPTNQPDPNNLRWVNIICDMLVPQRGILGGWAMLMPALNLLLPPMVARRRPDTRALLLAGMIAGALPLLHTHTYLALALMSLGMCVYAVVTAPHMRKMEAFRPYLLYGAVAVALSMPQLANFTFVQAGASDHFVRFQFNWCNNRGGRGLIDFYFWFYIKNIGLPYLMILLALLTRRMGDLREEALRAAALTDGLFMLEPRADTAMAAGAQPIAAKPSQKAAQADATANCAEAAAPESAPQPDSPAAPKPADDGEGDAPGSVIFHDMPAYGQSRLPVSPERATVSGPAPAYVRPLAPDKLRASAFSPEDNDRVGVMRAVTGDAQPETSSRPLLEEILQHTLGAEKDAQPEVPHRARATTPGNPETAFSDDPPPRDWVYQHRLLAAGAFLILLVAELIVFQPNEYDNNKLIYVWFLLCLPMAADWGLALFDRIRGLAGRRVLAILLCVTLFLSAGLTVAREAVSDYQAYTAADIAVADFVRAETPEHSVFMTGNQHLNPVASLAGRTIVCGSDLYLYYHGFSTTARKAEVRAFYEAPLANEAVLAQYGVRYVYVSAWERAAYDVDEATLRARYPVAYESADGSCLILAVPQGNEADSATNAPAAPTATPTA